MKYTLTPPSLFLTLPLFPSPSLPLPLLFFWPLSALSSDAEPCYQTDAFSKGTVRSDDNMADPSPGGITAPSWTALPGTVPAREIYPNRHGRRRPGAALITPASWWWTLNAQMKKDGKKEEC